MAILAMALSSRAISTGAARLAPRRTEAQQPRRGDLLVVAGKKKSKRKDEKGGEEGRDQGLDEQAQRCGRRGR